MIEGLKYLGLRSRALPVLAAATGCLVLLAACSPCAIRIPAGKAETLGKIAVVPLELRGITGQTPRYFNGGGDVAYLAGPRDNAVLGKEFGVVVVDGVPVFFSLRELDPGVPGQAERFEKLISGPRERWLASVDLAEIAARRLKASGVEATAEREVALIPGLTRRNPDGVPLDWWTPLCDWYAKDPDPLDLSGHANRGTKAVLVVAPAWVIPSEQSTALKLFVKLVDPVDGRVIARAEADQTGPESQSIDDFPAAFEGASRRAAEKVLKEIGLVHPE